MFSSTVIYEKGADSRTAKTLREEYASEEGSVRTGSVKESPATPVRSVSRLSKTKDTVSMRGRGGRGFGVSRLKQGSKSVSVLKSGFSCLLPFLKGLRCH